MHRYTKYDKYDHDKDEDETRLLARSIIIIIIIIHHPFSFPRIPFSLVGVGVETGGGDGVR